MSHVNPAGTPVFLSSPLPCRGLTDFILHQTLAPLCFEPAALHCAHNSVENYLKLCFFPETCDQRDGPLLCLLSWVLCRWCI